MTLNTINTQTRDALATLTIDGTHVRLTTGQLTPTQYAPIKQVLENLGGTWNRRLEALVFPTDPTAAIAEVIRTSRVPLHPRTAEGFVRTPTGIAEDLAAWPNAELDRLPAGARVLEPSAGDGRLVDAILAANPDLKVTAIEPNARRADAIDGTPGVELHRTTLEEYAATEPGQFDAIVMNPPFAVPGNPTIWIDHVRAAFELLAPGALLAAIVPDSYRYRSDPRHAEMRELVAAHGSATRLPNDAFKPSGTSIGAVILRLRKPLPGAGRAPHLLRRYTGAEAPVRVSDPRLTAEGVLNAPVQVWWDGWRKQDRVLRFAGQCFGCGWLLWAFDDGENDCRGVLGDFSAGFSLDAEGYGMVGPTVGLCPMCANTGSSYERAASAGLAVWSVVPEPVPWVPVAGVQSGLFDLENFVPVA